MGEVLGPFTANAGHLFSKQQCNSNTRSPKPFLIPENLLLILKAQARSWGFDSNFQTEADTREGGIFSLGRIFEKECVFLHCRGAKTLDKR